MRGTIILGKLGGIEVGLDYSWFIVFLLLTWSLTGHYLMTDVAGSASARLLLAVLTALLFFASVMAHEFGHALTARRLGVPVPRITLFIFGGVAQMAKEPSKALHEFWIALAGPLVSLVLAVVFFGLRLVGQASGIQALAALGIWLSQINLALAVFNLIPGFPLDGGRVLRALIWGFTGDLQRATRFAASIGQVVAIGFIAFGLWQLLLGNWVNGLWIAFIGWFLSSAASSSGQQATLEALLQGHVAREVIMPDCPQTQPWLTLEQLVNQTILISGRRCFPVVEESRLTGLITLHQIKEVPRERWPFTRVDQVMIPLDRLHTTRPQEALLTVIQQMGSAGVNQLPVMEEGRFVGMVTRENLLGFLHTLQEVG